MAGIGFELRRLSRSTTYFGLLRAYLYAGIIGSGPWVLSILAILILGVLSLGAIAPASQVGDFQISVTWLIALSLIYSGGTQLAYTRYVADRLFERESARVLPNLFGILLITGSPLLLISIPLSLWLLPATSPAYRLLMIVSLNLLNLVWVLTVLLSGLKQYRWLLLLYFLGYGGSDALGFALLRAGFGTEGLLFGFVIGQAMILMGALALIWREYPPERLIEFDFLRPGRLHLWLLPTGLLFNAGVWADKLLFWLSPGPGQRVIGDLHASMIYDKPIFLSYFTLIPGMAVFLLRMEVDFVHAYEHYYGAVRDGGALSAIRAYRTQMVVTAREGIYDIIKVQGFTLLALIALGPSLLAVFRIPTLYFPLLAIDSVGVGLQLLVMAGLNILFYLDRLRTTAAISAIMLLGNLAFSYLSLLLGPFYYGYGFVLAMLVPAVLVLAVIDRAMDRLNYTTFMLR
ncbi:MAG TPA: exopolysaccharide Pel transporter PelG [Steroidobacteraceae bacterium]|nr:exopolysaccharide Pel transporter PelG [Steroidobacteraceae bacterium]